MVGRSHRQRLRRGIASDRDDPCSLYRLGPIGAIIQSIIGVINAIASLICSALPQDMQSGEWGQWLCGGITGALTNALKRLLYLGTLLFEIDPKDTVRLELNNYNTKLANENAGVVTGNKMTYSVQLTNTIDCEYADRVGSFGGAVQRRQPATGKLQIRATEERLARGSPWAMSGGWDGWGLEDYACAVRWHPVGRGRH
jgi:hypothetical protein